MSTSAQPIPPTMTVAQFLAWDDGTDARYELVDGRIVAMVPPSPEHSTIAANIAAALQPRLSRPCRVRVEYGVRLADDERNYFQADLAVVCAEIRRDAPAPEPTAIIEIVSPSTYDHDRGRKRSAYMQLETCQLMLFIATDRRHVELWTREGDRWVVQDHIGDSGTIPLTRLGTSLDVAEIYEGADVP